MTYIGYVIDKNGLRTCSNIVKAILNASEPNNVTDVKRSIQILAFIAYIGLRWLVQTKHEPCKGIAMSSVNYLHLQICIQVNNVLYLKLDLKKYMYV